MLCHLTVAFERRSYQMPASTTEPNVLNLIKWI